MADPVAEAKSQSGLLSSWILTFYATPPLALILIISASPNIEQIKIKQ